MTDRGQALSLVEAALKSGRIVQADHDMRIDQIKNAPSEQDIGMIVRDLQAPAAVAAVSAPPMAGTPTPGQPWPLVNYGPGQGQPAAAQMVALTKTGGKAMGGIIALVVLISVIVPIAGVIIGLVSAKDTFDDINFGEPVDETTYLPGQAPGENGVNVHTIDGYNDLVVALEEETGSTEVFSAVLYPRYAVLYIPEEPTGRRYEYYYWDGHSLEPNDSKATSDAPRIDLATIDAGVMVTLLETVRGRIDDPTSWYVNISSTATEGPQLAVYASNEYGEGAYILATADGTITYESEYGG